MEKRNGPDILSQMVIIIGLIGLALSLGCGSPNPNMDSSGVDELSALALNRQLSESGFGLLDTIYVPIYSDIYIDPTNPKNLLAATLSIRNTSLTDSLFVTQIDYYDTAGHLVKAYLDGPISLSPMGTINYVIEQSDDTGGPGANFLVMLQARSEKVKPIVQSVMIGHYDNKAFSFAINGISLVH